MDKRRHFIYACIAAALCSFFSEVIEYAGFEYLAFAGIVALLSIVAIVAAIAIGVRTWRNGSRADGLAGVATIAVLPFIVGLALEIHGAELNVHGLAILAFFAYTLISLTAAVGFLIAVFFRRALPNGGSDSTGG